MNLEEGVKPPKIDHRGMVDAMDQTELEIMGMEIEPEVDPGKAMMIDRLILEIGMQGVVVDPEMTDMQGGAGGMRITDRKRGKWREREIENVSMLVQEERSVHSEVSSRRGRYQRLIKQDEKPAVEPEKPNFGSSGLLAKETNTVKGVELKYNEPPEARKPLKNWRLYVFKGKEQLGESSKPSSPLLPLSRIIGMETGVATLATRASTRRMG